MSSLPPSLSASPGPAPATSTSSLSSQLLPLSLSLLKSPSSSSSSTAPTSPPPSRKPIWINPSKPKPSILTLHRHPRKTPFSTSSLPSNLASLLRSLRSSPDADLPSLLDSSFPSLPPLSTFLFLLNNLRSYPTKSLIFLSWLKARDPSSKPDTIFYNVVLKSLRDAAPPGRQWESVESLAQDMLADGVPLDNISYSTIITAAKRCRRFDKAVEWFERMYQSGVLPDEVTYSAVLDVYARMGKREEVMALFDRARAAGWTPDPVAFSVLGKMFGEAGDYDGIMFVLKEMNSIGVTPNLVVYNALLEALGKTRKPSLARRLFEEMIAAGVEPNERTLTALAKIYGKARWGRDAIELWERMRARGWPMDFILYNTLLSMCADLGMVAEAEQLFDDMKREGNGVKPDSWSYAAMINIYGSVGDVERSLELFHQMLGTGVEPNIMCYTCLIQCLGKARRATDAVKVFETALARGVRPDDRLCGCLLSLVALSGPDEVQAAVACLEAANTRLAKLIAMLQDDGIGFEELKSELMQTLNAAGDDVRRPYCNCLIDVCRNHGFPPRRPHELLRLASGFGLYPGLHSRSPKDWSLNLRSLSVGAAVTAFDEWLQLLSAHVAQPQEELPPEFRVHAGAGNHKFSQGLAGAFAANLEKLGAPFRLSGDKGGVFVASKADLVSWLQSGSATSF